MKTKYQKPETNIVLMSMQQMVCTSTPGIGGKASDTNELLSREAPSFSDWDDEEE